MATPAQVATLRQLIADNATPPKYDNNDLSARIDAADGDLRAVAGDVWTMKASELAGLVDVTEGSSSRKLGSLYKQALEMATFYGAAPSAASTVERRSGTRPISRPLA